MIQSNDTKLDRLIEQRNIVEYAIGWIKSEGLEELKKERLTELLRELELLTKQIVSAEFEIFEQKTLAERAATKAILAAMRLPIAERNGQLFINP